MDQLSELYHELCLNYNSKQNSLYSRIVKKVMDRVIRRPKSLGNLKCEFLTAEEFIEQYPFCALGTLKGIYQKDREFRKICCKVVDDEVTYSPYRTFKYIKENQSQHYKLNSRLLEKNYYGYKLD